MGSSIRHVETISYDDFLVNIASSDPVPLLIGPSLTRSWAASAKWANADGSPDLDALRQYVYHEVQVADCSKRSFNEFERECRPLGEVLDLWAEGRGQSLYVKDWHCVLDIEQTGGKMQEVYETPNIFKDDWLTPFLLRAPSAGQAPSDYRFVYVGPPGTFTPFHRDVFGSYSWSANVAGRKRWWLIRPEDVHLFQEEDGSAAVFDLRELEKNDPRWVKIQVVEQPPGHTIFVPSGWWHQVENLDFCISINHNFIASPMLPAVWKNLLAARDRCAASIADVRDMIEQRLGDQRRPRGDASMAGRPDILLWQEEWVDEVQKLLDMDFGMDFAGFWRMVLWNLRNPSAPPDLSPDRSALMRNILPIIADYKRQPEWDILDEVRTTVVAAQRAPSEDDPVAAI